MVICAGIDIGTNTVRLLIAQGDGHGGMVPLAWDQRVIRLGEGLGERGLLSASAMERALTTLREFRQRIDRFGPIQVRAVATEAVRRANNRNLFLDRVLQETGILPQVLSEPEEAHLALRGVLAGVQTSGRVAVLDIGGGSTEFSLVDETGRMLASRSLKLGVVTLTEGYLRAIPTDEGEFQTLVEVIKQQLVSLAADVALAQAEQLIGTAGTITTLAALDLKLSHYDPLLVNNHPLKRQRLISLLADLKGMSLEERRRIPALEPGREDVIIAGGAILLQTMEQFGFTEVVVSDAGLREGVILEMLSSV